VEFLEVFD
jgi:hypothetical protein